MVRYRVGFGVGKAIHWVCVPDEEGRVVLSRKVEVEERAIAPATPRAWRPPHGSDSHATLSSGLPSSPFGSLGSWS